jgi:hypothetical protein
MSQIAGMVACGGTEDIRTVCDEYPKGASRSQPAPPVDSSESNPYDWRTSLHLGQLFPPTPFDFGRNSQYFCP